MNDAVRARIFKVMTAVLGVPAAALSDDSAQAGVEGWDSLTHIHLIMALETEFGVSFTPDQAVDMTTVQAIHRALVERGVSG